MSANGVVGVILASVVLAVPSAGYAQPAKVYVEGGPKDIKQQVLALVAASTDMVPVPYAKQPVVAREERSQAFQVTHLRCFDDFPGWVCH